MPDTIGAVSRLLPDCSRDNDYPSVSMSLLRFRHVISGSLTFVSLTLT